MAIKSSLLNYTLQSVALAVALTANASASTICISGYCNTPPVPPVEGVGPIQGPILSVEPGVLELVPFQNANGWNYFFSVSGVDIVSVSAPYFDGWGANNVNTPEGWTYQVVPASSSPLSNDVALWERQSGIPDSYYSVGASFTSAFSPTLITVEIRNEVGSVFERQLLIPLTPSAISAGYTAAVPIPASVWLFGTALIGLRGIVRTVGCSKRGKVR
jgi:hypothetical protein